MVEKKKVLVVDDSEINICLLCEMLKDYDIETHTALNGKEALDKINTSSPDMVISDFMMPEMNGLELLSEIKRNSRNVKLPVVIVSATVDESVKKKALRLGAAAFINKPLENKTIKEKIISFL